MRIYILLFFVFISITSCVQWDLDRLEIIAYDRTINNSDTNIGHLFKKEIVETDNNYVVAGNTIDGNLLLSFFEKNGTYDYERSFEFGEANSVIKIGDNLGVISNIDSTFFLNVFNTIGNIDNNYNYFDDINTEIGLLDYVQAQDIIELENGDFIISATVKQLLGGERLALIKINSFFGFEWLRSFQNNSTIVTLAENNSGNIIGSGYSDGKAFVSLYATNGTQLNSKIYNQSLVDSLNSVIHFNDKIFFTYTSTKDADHQIAVVCLDQDFNTVWNNNLSDSNFKGYSLIPTSDSTLLVLGSDFLNSNNVHLINFSQEGDFNWSETYDGVTFQQPYSLFQTERNGLVLFGATENSNENQFRLIRTDSQGKLE